MKVCRGAKFPDCVCPDFLFSLAPLLAFVGICWYLLVLVNKPRWEVAILMSEATTGTYNLYRRCLLVALDVELPSTDNTLKGLGSLGVLH